jgi:hypothetical protein
MFLICRIRGKFIKRNSLEQDVTLNHCCPRRSVALSLTRVDYTANNTSEDIFLRLGRLDLWARSAPSRQASQLSFWGSRGRGARAPSDVTVEPSLELTQQLELEDLDFLL